MLRELQPAAELSGVSPMGLLVREVSAARAEGREGPRRLSLIHI